MTQAKKPYIIIVSGPNGAGKTTFRNNIMVQTPELSGAVFLNYDDEIANLKQIPEYSMQYKMIEQEMQASSLNLFIHRRVLLDSIPYYSTGFRDCQYLFGIFFYTRSASMRST